MSKVVLMKVDESLPLKEQLFASLDSLSQEKALRYLREEDQVRSALASLFIRKEVGEGLIEKGPYGKPFITGKPFFNISHSYNWVGICVDNEEIGFDIELISRCDLSIAKAAFTKEEQSLIHDQESFAQAWTRKEAIAKCLGRGIEKPSLVGALFLQEHLYSYKEETYYLHEWLEGGYAFCVAKKTPGDAPVPIVIKLSDLLR